LEYPDVKKYWRLKYDLKPQVGNTGQIRMELWDRLIAVGGKRASHVFKMEASQEI
jgi:hypothetical protein